MVTRGRLSKSDLTNPPDIEHETVEEGETGEEGEGPGGWDG